MHPKLHSFIAHEEQSELSNPALQAQKPSPFTTQSSISLKGQFLHFLLHLGGLLCLLKVMILLTQLTPVS